MKMSLKEVKAGYPPEKRKSDSLWARILIRELSFYVAWLAVRLNISAFTVSFLSLLMPLAAMFFWLTANPLPAIVLLNLWLLFDCADGNVARVTGGSRMGDFVDATSGYMILGFAFLGLGAYLDSVQTPFPLAGMQGYTLLGAIVSILNILTRLYYQKYANVLNRSESREEVQLANPKGLIKHIDHNVGIGGFFTPLLLAALYADLLAPLLLLYAVYTLTYFTAISTILLKKAKNL